MNFAYCEITWNKLWISLPKNRLNLKVKRQYTGENKYQSISTFKLSVCFLWVCICNSELQLVCVVTWHIDVKALFSATKLFVSSTESLARDLALKVLRKSYRQWRTIDLICRQKMPTIFVLKSLTSAITIVK